MKIFDTHAHYMSNDFVNDIDDVLKKIKECGVDKTCEVSASLEDSVRMQNFLSKYNNDNNNYPSIYHSIGIHPDEIKNFEYDSEEFVAYFDKLESCLNNEKNFYRPVAFGEIGLDYYGDKDDDTKLNQKMWFIEQIKLAKKYDLPLIIHSRDGCLDTLNIIKEYAKDYKGIIHCFSYEKEIAMEYVNMGYMIGVGGVVTYKNGRKLQEVVESIPIEKIVTETDSPYLTPVPKRGERNDSSNIIYIIDTIAAIKNKQNNELAEILYNNGLEVYGINN